MAKYGVTCKCGKEFYVNLVGKHKYREWKLENTEWTCDECIQKARDDANRKNALENEGDGLPKLTGTEKQIQWAETLRCNVSNKIDALKADELLKLESEYPEAISTLLSIDNAAWWIDNRYSSLELILKDVCAKHTKNAVSRIEAIAKAEATVAPSKMVTPTVAEITCTSDTISINFNEIREDFKKIMKANKFSWGGNAWKRKIVPTNGAVEDRVAEIGNVLLNAGFAICIYDETLRKKAINAEYKQEHTRWVMRRKEGKYADWFAIRWDKSCEDYYKQSMKLSSARYNMNVLVSPEHFEEVLDFAEQFGFMFTDAAYELLQDAQEAKLKVLIPENIKASKRKENIAKTHNFDITVEAIDGSLRD